MTETTAASLAETIAAYLNDRDDVATADVIAGETPPTIGVATQGGAEYFVTVVSA